MNEQTKSPCTPPASTNPDPVTGAPGAHLVGAGLGAVGAGAAMGAAGGVIAGPVGAAVGAVAGAVVGGLAGKAAAEAVNPSVESKHWRETHASGPYAKMPFSYEEFVPAYQYGWESFGRRGGEGRTFDSLEADLKSGWDQAKGASRLRWDQARAASRDAWARVERAGSATEVRSAV